MKTAVLRSFALVLIIALVVCGVFTAAFFGIRQADAKEKELTRIAQIIAGQFDPSGDQNAAAKSFAELLTGVRVTIIDGDGNVKGDSAVDFTTMENHANRAEIMEASGTTKAVSVRQSSTMGKRLMYTVIRTPDDYYIRLAEEYSGAIEDLISLMPTAGFSAFFSLLVTIFIANSFSKKITGPVMAINSGLIGVMDGSKKLNPDDYTYEELRDMAGKINEMAADISGNIEKLQREKDKIAFILDSMNEGFILLDERQVVLLINDSACIFMNCGKNIVGQDILHCTQNYDFLRTVEAFQSGERERALIDIIAAGRVIETEFIRVSEGGGGVKAAEGSRGADRTIITMTDVTDRRSALKTRRDFFANASHELKTPITSIKGSAELLCSDIPLKEGQQKELLTRIGLETERMYSLINDIIMINRVESGKLIERKDEINYAATVRECVEEILPFAGQNSVSVNMDLEPVKLRASQKDLYEMVSNLIMNAVKYNRPGGAVDICLKVDGGNSVLAVRNDGEPIPREHHARVFERFYRVDKGRSKTAGGTGLGLSIVKHVVESFGGTIALESNHEIGTKLTVKIPV